LRRVDKITVRKYNVSPHATNIEVVKESFTAPDEYAGKRVDIAIAEHIPSISRSRIRKLIDKGLVLVDGEPIKASKKLCGGEEIELSLPSAETIDAEPEDIEVEIVFEDDDIVIVNKPSGMVVHPGSGTSRGTLVNALLFKCSNLSDIGGAIRPGIVHRLDKDTSGIMVVAKNDATHRSLVEQFQERTVEKTYIAIVAGRLKAAKGEFSDPIGRHPKDRIKMSTKSKRGKESLTLWNVVERFNGASLVEVNPKTGRTHQIRVHFKDSGYPLLGDKLYGPRKYNTPFIQKLSAKLGRHALHAFSIRFTNPTSSMPVYFEAPIANEMIEIISELRKGTNV